MINKRKIFYYHLSNTQMIYIFFFFNIKCIYKMHLKTKKNIKIFNSNIIPKLFLKT